MNMTPTAAQPTYPSPQSFSLPDSESFELDAPIRVYDSDQSLCVTLVIPRASRPWQKANGQQA
jgi:hypothetical protein